jgi:hypothetical protein
MHSSHALFACAASMPRTMIRTQASLFAPPNVDQSVAIFSSREDCSTLVRTIDAAKLAVHCQRAQIDVVINGNPSLADELKALLSLNGLEADPPARKLQVWRVDLGDKAHAWNHYVKYIWPRSRLGFFVDGMVRVRENALDAIADALFRDPEAWAGTGVPTRGMSARWLRRQMLATGGIHGNLYAIRGDVLQRLVDSGFSLPLGIYRSDPLLGALMCFSLDPAGNAWDDRRIRVVADASWGHDTLKWWSVGDWRTHLKRKRRQWQGVLENAAIRQWLAIDRRDPANISSTAAELVATWVRDCPQEAGALLRKHPHCREALITLTSRRDWSAAATPPTLLGHQAF